jgi:hypothetical protein
VKKYVVQQKEMDGIVVLVEVHHNAAQLRLLFIQGSSKRFHLRNLTLSNLYTNLASAPMGSSPAAMELSGIAVRWSKPTGKSAGC